MFILYLCMETMRNCCAHLVGSKQIWTTASKTMTDGADDAISCNIFPRLAKMLNLIRWLNPAKEYRLCTLCRHGNQAIFATRIVHHWCNDALTTYVVATCVCLEKYSRCHYCGLWVLMGKQEESETVTHSHNGTWLIRKSPKSRGTC